MYNPQSREPAGFRLWVLKGCHGNREEKRGREGAHAGGDRAEPGGEGLVTADVRGQQRTQCAQRLPCARLQQPQLLYALRVCRRNVSFNSSSSPRAKHPPAPRSLGASSPSSCLQETKGTCSSPGSLPFSKLSASDQGHPQPQSEPRQVQVALSVPQQTPVSCLHWSAQLAILQRPAFCPLCLARAYQGHGSRRGAQQRCWLQTIPVPCSQSVSQSQTHQAHHTQSPAQAQHHQWHSAGQTAKWLSQAG